METELQENITRDWAKIAYWLVGGTLLYNVVEGVIALWAGFSADSPALVGFGFDSVIESAAAGVLLWRVTVEAGGADHAEVQRVEVRSQKFIGLTFFLLAGYISLESILTLTGQRPPSESYVGIVLAILSLLIMPVLAYFKFKAADHLESRALRAEAKETLACGYLSFTLLLGLSLNALVPSLWWADPVAALLMVPWLVYEGIENVG